MKHALILALLLVAGCKMETPQVNRGCQPVEAIVTYSDETRSEMSVRPGNGLAKFGNGVTVEAFEDGVVRVCVGRFRPSEVDSAYSAGVHDGLNSQRTVIVNQSDSSAKVAAVMAANDITLPQVVAFLYAYGFDVVSRSNTLRPHWTAAPPGRDAQGNIVPVAYYVANLRIAVGDTTLAIYAPQAVGPVWMRVKAYDGRGMSGIWSVTEVSGTGDLLPGVAE